MEINNCPSCGGKVEFSPDDMALKCEKCSSVFSIELKPAGEKKGVVVASINNQEGFSEWKESKRGFCCSNCGAQVVLNKYEMVTKCSYCNTSSLVPTEALPGLKPDGIIPFKISKEKANEHFKEKTKKKMFIPNDFKKNLPKTQIGATYISSFSFDIDSFATYHGMREVSRTVTRQVRDLNGGYRTETQTITELRPFSGSIKHNFNDIVIESSEKISQDQITGVLPYYFKESYDYNDDFIVGYSAEYYNQTVTDANKNARNVVLANLDSMIRSKHAPVRSLTINPSFSNERYNYVMLPLYFINFKYKDKEFLNLMNGQTGATSGKIPRSGTKITFFVLSIVLTVIGIPLLIILLTTLL